MAGEVTEVRQVVSRRSQRQFFIRTTIAKEASKGVSAGDRHGLYFERTHRIEWREQV